MPQFGFINLLNSIDSTTKVILSSSSAASRIASTKADGYPWSKKPLLTRETARSAMTNASYSSKKIQKYLGFKFTDINITIKKYSNWFLADLT